MLFALTFPCYLTTFSGEKCLSGKAICAAFCPAYRSSPVLVFHTFKPKIMHEGIGNDALLAEHQFIRHPYEGNFLIRSERIILVREDRIAMDAIFPQFDLLSQE
jgi:hypothetical protein